MFGVFLKVTEAIGQSYIDYYCKNSNIQPDKSVKELTSIDKIYLWLKADIDDLSPE